MEIEEREEDKTEEEEEEEEEAGIGSKGIEAPLRTAVGEEEESATNDDARERAR